MGLIVVSGPRTGSTNLMYSLASSYSIPYIFEPDILTDFEYSNYKDNVVKYVPLADYNLDYYNRLIEIIKQFDVIILLDRKNKEEQSESFYSLKNYGTFYKKWGHQYIDKISEQYKDILRDIKIQSEVLLKLSEDLNLEIDYYEDLFNNKTLTDITIGLDTKYLNNKYKLRQTTMTII